MYEQVMLVSPAKVKSYAVVGLNLDEGNLGNYIRIAHIRIREVLGDDMLERLRELVYNKVKGLPDTIDDPENEAWRTLLDDYVTPALAYATAVEAAVINELKIRNAGTVKNSDTNVITTAPVEYNYLSDYYRTYANDAYNRMWDFLCSTPESFPQLPEGKCGCKKRPLYGNINLWLG